MKNIYWSLSAKEKSRMIFQERNSDVSVQQIEKTEKTKEVASTPKSPEAVVPQRIKEAQKSLDAMVKPDGFAKGDIQIVKNPDTKSYMIKVGDKFVAQIGERSMSTFDIDKLDTSVGGIAKVKIYINPQYTGEQLKRAEKSGGMYQGNDNIIITKDLGTGEFGIENRFAVDTGIPGVKSESELQEEAIATANEGDERRKGIKENLEKIMYLHIGDGKKEGLESFFTVTVLKERLERHKAELQKAQANENTPLAMQKEKSLKKDEKDLDKTIKEMEKLHGALNGYLAQEKGKNTGVDAAEYSIIKTKEGKTFTPKDVPPALEDAQRSYEVAQADRELREQSFREEVAKKKGKAGR